MVTAYMLARIESGKDKEVLDEVKKMTGVQSAVPTYGMFDLHVEVIFESTDELDKFIFDKMRRIQGVKETVTLIAFKRM